MELTSIWKLCLYVREGKRASKILSSDLQQQNWPLTVAGELFCYSRNQCVHKLLLTDIMTIMNPDEVAAGGH